MNSATYSVLIASLVLLLSACMPLKQTDIVSRSSDIIGSYYGGCVDYSIDQRYWTETYEVNQETSYVVDPKGKKYNIILVPNQWDIEQGRQPRHELCIKNPDGTIKKSWSDGIWKIVFNLENDHSKRTKELELKLWTFIYSPFIHGAPN